MTLPFISESFIVWEKSKKMKYNQFISSFMEHGIPQGPYIGPLKDIPYCISEDNCLELISSKISLV